MLSRPPLKCQPNHAVRWVVGLVSMPQDTPGHAFQTLVFKGMAAVFGTVKLRFLKQLKTLSSR